MFWRILAAVGLVAVAASARAEDKPVGTITYGDETIEIVYAAAHRDPAMGVLDLEFFNQAVPAGETYFTLDSDVTDALRGMRLRISEDPAYKNGTWMHPSIDGSDQFYYFDEGDPIVLTYETKADRIAGSIVGEDRIGGTAVKVKLSFDLPITTVKE